MPRPRPAEQSPRQTVAYLRVSSDEQRERQTIETQRSELVRYAEHRKLSISHYYEDDGVSGTIPLTHRPQGSRLWQEIAAGRVRSVLVFRLDRLARSALDLLRFIEHCDAHNTQIGSVTEQVDTSTSSGRLLLNITAAFAQNERDVISERTTAGLRRRAVAGKVSTLPPFGFVVRDGKLAIDEERAAVMRRIFKEYAGGVNTREIVRRLNAAEVPAPRGPKWRCDTTIYLLKHPAYMGEYTSFWTPKRRKSGGTRIRRDESERVTIPCPAIVSRELFDEVQKRLAFNRAGGRAKAKREYLLTGLIYCGKCGRTYVGHTITGRAYKGKRYPDFSYYECGTVNNRDYEHCGNPRVRADQIDALVWSYIEDFLRHPSRALEQLAREEERRSATGGRNALRQLPRLAGEQNKIAEARRRIVGAIGRGVLTDADATKELDALARESARIDAELKRVEEFSHVAETHKRQVADARTLLEGLAAELDREVTPRDKAKLMRKLVERVTIDPVTDERGRRRPHAKISYLLNQPEPQADSFSFGSDASALPNAMVPQLIMTCAHLF